jgi:hypothetical protein
MTQRPRTDLGFVKLSDSYFVLENPEQDIRGKMSTTYMGNRCRMGLHPEYSSRAAIRLDGSPSIGCTRRI